MESVRILLADDHPVFRHGLRNLLADTSDLQVAGEASTGDEAVRLAETLQPHVVLMDLRMPVDWRPRAEFSSTVRKCSSWC